MTLVLTPSEIVSKLEKNGELGLLGKAPRWNRRLLGELINVQNGAPFSSDKFNREGLGMPLIRIRDVGASETSTYFDGEYDPAYVVRAGDLLVGMDGDFRCAKWTSGDALLNQRVCRLKVISAELDERFLFLILQGYLDAIWKETSATTVKHLSSKSIQQIPIPLPSMKEQRKIVELLEDHLSRLDAALADVKQAKHKAAQFRRSLLQAAFNGNLTGDETRLMTSWRRVSFATILEPRKTKDIPAKFPDVPYIGMEHVAKEVGKIEYLGVSAEYRSSAPKVEKGDVLYGRLRPYLNKVVIAPIEAFASGEFIVLPENEAIGSKFLQYRLLCQDFVNFAGTLDTGDRPRVSWDQISKFEIELPPLSEQQKIVELLEDHLSRLDASVAIADAMEKQSSSLRRSLLQAAFTGQLTKEVASV